MNRGYVKLWRKSLDSGLLQNAEAWQLLTWCLLKASHKPHRQLLGKQVVDLEPGQLVFGRIAAARELRTTQQRIRTSLKLLENLEFLTIKPTNKFSVITIVKWETYQQDQPPTNQQMNHQATIKQPSSNHQSTTNKNEEHSKNGENKEIKLHSPELCQFVRRFQAYAVELHGIMAPKVTEASYAKSCDAVDKIIRLDGFSLEEIRDTMKWAVKDDFWSANARSLAQLRQRSKNGLTKFQNIHAAWKKETGYGCDDDAPCADLEAVRREAIRKYGRNAG